MTDPMEAIGCREGLALASDLAVRKIRLATDNISVVRNIKSGSKGVYAHIVEEIRVRVGAFMSAEFVHKGLAKAHNLASSVYCVLGRMVWLLSPPEGICISVLESSINKE